MATWEPRTASRAAAKSVLSPPTRMMRLGKAYSPGAGFDLSQHRPLIEAWDMFRIAWAMRVASLPVMPVMVMVKTDLANGVCQNERKQARDDVICLGRQSPFAAHGVYMELETMS